MMKEKWEKLIHNRVFVIISILVLICILLLTGTYAWFTWSSANNTNLTMTIGKMADVIFTSGNDITTGLTPVFNYTDGESTTFSIINRDTSGSSIQYSVKLNITTIAPELVSESVKYALVKDGNLVAQDDLSTAGNGISLPVYSDVLASGTTSYVFYLYIDANMENSSHMMNKTIVGNLTVEATSEVANSFASYITSLYTEADKSTFTADGISYSYASSENLMNDRLGGTTGDFDAGNIRYYGDDADNYVYFNCDDYNVQTSTTCEKWRIIGVFDGKVKIIKDEKIEDYAWDETTEWQGDGLNNWRTSTLQEMLNSGSYYETLTSNTKKLISSSTWYLGGWSKYDLNWSYVGATLHDLYTNERGNLKCSDCTYDVTWPGQIALMYPSDYAYAVDYSSSCGSGFSSSCNSENWLYNNDYQWLLTMDYKQSNMPWYVDSSGNVEDSLDGSGMSSNTELGVRPTLYLNDTVTYNGIGSGTSGDPYQLIATSYPESDITYVDFVVTADNRDMIGYTDTTTELEIPATFQSTRAYDADGDGVEEPAGTLYKVTSIGNSAFEGCTNLTSVDIPEGVTTIGNYAFFECYNLTSAIIQEGVISIGASAFQDCETLTNITIPTTVTSIGSNAFNRCINIESIVIPNGVTIIENGTFQYCYSLESIVIPDGVISIGASAFSESGLMSVKIAKSVTSIGDMAFYYSNLTDVYYTGSEEEWNAIQIGEANEYLTNATIYYNY